LEERVGTVFDVVDRSSGPLKEIARNADKVADSTERAKRSAKEAGGAPAAPMAHGGGHAFEGSSAEEKEQFKAVREELRARRSRTRFLRLEEQRQNIYERAIESSSRSLVGANKGAGGTVERMAGQAEAIGYSMAAFGGTLGKIGGLLVKIGGPIGAAIAAFEVGEFVLNKMGVNVEGVIARLTGVGEAALKLEEQETLQAKYLGYRNLKEYQMVEQLEHRAKQEAAMSHFIQKSLGAMEAKPLDQDSSAADEWAEARRKAILEASKASNIPIDEVTKAFDEAAQHTYKATAQKAAREAELAQIENNAMRGMKAVPLDADAEQTKAHIEEVRGVVAQLVRSKDIYAQEADAVMQSMLARQDSIQNLVARHQESADAEARIEQAASMYAKLLPKIPIHATVDQMLRFNAAFAQISEQAAGALEAMGLKSPEQFKQFQEALAKKATRHYDFRGSRFEIKQAFAEGFDPDRIAVAFANDLATLGETRIQSQHVYVPGAVR
jgi:hypothetical protein